MKNKLPVSVFIISTNEETRIKRTIQAVIDWVDEVVLIDGGSTDKTPEIAKKLGCKVIKNKWQGYGPQKIFGEKQCKNDWILNLDSDEIITPELKEEIITLFKTNQQNQYFGYRIKIVNIFKNEEKPKLFAYYYNQTRLYNHKKAGFRNSKVHDSVIVSGVKEYSEKERKVVGQLKNRILHDFMISYNQWIEKINKYTQMLAVDAVKEGKKVSKMKLMVMPIFLFLKVYFIRRYFLYGINGLVFSHVYTMSKYLKYVKINELTQERK